jgi:cytochrome c oxidase cbb3-type subunit 3
MNDNDKKIDQLRPSSYDGIQEYDNDLPRWWVWLFYLTIVYGVVYYIGFAGYGITIPPVPHDPSVGVVAQATPEPGAPTAPVVDEVALIRAKLNDAATKAQGKAVFDARCAPCHGATGGGVIGPNLTDDTWIHGGSLGEIQKVIENGVVEKGMLAWKNMIGKEDTYALVVYIRSLRGSKPAGAKAAEGQPFTGDDAT